MSLLSTASSEDCYLTESTLTAWIDAEASGASQQPAVTLSSSGSPGRPKTVEVSLSDIRIDGGTQSRTELNNAAVDEYRELMKEGTEFPPITVYHDGTTYWLADGFHRFFATKNAGILKIKAEVREGSQRDAILHAVGANAGHGLRRTNEDKRKAVTILLNDPEWSQWSNREVARRASVGEQMVRSTRDQLRFKRSCETPEAEPVKRMGADGKARKLPERKQLAPEPWDAPVLEGALGGSAPTAASPSVTAAVEQPARLKDGQGNPVPESLLPAFRIRHELREIANLQHEVVKKFKVFEKQNRRGAERLDCLRIRLDMENARKAIICGSPHVPCPVQSRTEHKNCKSCKGAKFLSKHQFDQLNQNSQKVDPSIELGGDDHNPRDWKWLIAGGTAWDGHAFNRDLIGPLVRWVYERTCWHARVNGNGKRTDASRRHNDRVGTLLEQLTNAIDQWDEEEPV